MANNPAFSNDATRITSRRLRRFWGYIKPPPLPQREWEVEIPSVWRRMWDALKPPPPVGTTPEIRRRRRLILGRAVFGTVTFALLLSIWIYIRSAPDRAESTLEQGIRLAAAGDSAEAVARFTRAIAIHPQFAAAYLQRGLARQDLREPESAIRDLQSALKLNPKLAAAHSALGSIYREYRAAGPALAEFTAAIAIQPSTTQVSEDAYYQRGQVYASLGEFDHAIQDFTAAIALLPDAPYMYRARATAELSLGNRDRAGHDRALANAIEHSGSDSR